MWLGEHGSVVPPIQANYSHKSTFRRGDESHASRWLTHIRSFEARSFVVIQLQAYRLPGCPVSFLGIVDDSSVRASSLLSLRPCAGPGFLLFTSYSASSRQTPKRLVRSTTNYFCSFLRSSPGCEKFTVDRSSGAENSGWFRSVYTPCEFPIYYVSSAI